MLFATGTQIWVRQVGKTEHQVVVFHFYCIQLFCGGGNGGFSSAILTENGGDILPGLFQPGDFLGRSGFARLLVSVSTISARRWASSSKSVHRLITVHFFGPQTPLYRLRGFFDRLISNMIIHLMVSFPGISWGSTARGSS